MFLLLDFEFEILIVKKRDSCGMFVDSLFRLKLLTKVLLESLYVVVNKFIVFLYGVLVLLLLLLLFILLLFFSLGIS